MGLSRVEELLEARVPKYLSVISPFTAEVKSIETEGINKILTLVALEKEVREYYITDETMSVSVKKGDTVEEKQIIARSKESKQKLSALKAGRVVKVTDTVISIEDLVPETASFEVSVKLNLLVNVGDIVER